MAGPYCYDYPRPALTADIVVFRIQDGQLEVLLIQRRNPPFQDHWAIVGGFVDQDEGLLHAAKRELAEETGITGIQLRQFRTFGAPGRDPRGHTVSVAFLTLVPASLSTPRAGDDAAALAWFPATDFPPLAFDHDRVLRFARPALKRQVCSSPLVLGLLPKHFDFAEMAALLQTLGLTTRSAAALLAKLERKGKIRVLPQSSTFEQIE